MRGGDKPKIRKLKAGALLTEQGKPGDEVFLVLDGVLAVEVDGEPLAEFGPGAILGERAVLEGGVRTSTLRAVTKCRVAVAQGDQLDRKVLEQISQGHRREHDQRVRLLFCGVRGSTSAPGAEFVRVGGHTSCVALAHDGEPWSLAARRGHGHPARHRRISTGDPFVGSSLLTHLHWDHVQGLPFFAAGDRDDSRVRVLMPDQSDATCDRRACARAMSPPHFPIGPDGLHGRLDVRGRRSPAGTGSRASRSPRSTCRTRAAARSASGSTTTRTGRRSRTSPITSRSPRRTPRSRRVCAGVDLLVHDAQFLVPEQAVADVYGHATVDDALDAGAASAAPARSPCSTTGPPAPTTRSTRSGDAPRPGRASRSSSPGRRRSSSWAGAIAVVSVAMPIRVVIAEDSYLLREGVVRLLEAQDDVEVVGACGDFDELLATVDAELPDVVLTDIRMPPTGTDEGVRAANVLREKHPDIGVVMLSQYAEPAYALALLEHGSAGPGLSAEGAGLRRRPAAARDPRGRRRRVGDRSPHRRGAGRGAVAPARLAARAPHAA